MVLNNFSYLIIFLSIFIVFFQLKKYLISYLITIVFTLGCFALALKHEPGNSHYIAGYNLLILNSAMTLFAQLVLGAKFKRNALESALYLFPLILSFYYIETTSFLLIFFVHISFMGIYDFLLSGSKKVYSSRTVLDVAPLRIVEILLVCSFLLCFYFGTGGISFQNIEVLNYDLFLLSVVLMVMILIIRLGVYPLQSWFKEVISNTRGSVLVSKLQFEYFFCSSVLFILITHLVSYLEFEDVGRIQSISAIVASLSIFLNFISALRDKEIKNLVCSFIIINGSILLLFLSVYFLERNVEDILSNFFFMVSLCSIFLVMVNFLQRKRKEADSFDLLSGLGKSNSIFGWIIFFLLLNLFCFPLTPGYFSQVKIFSLLWQDENIVYRLIGIISFSLAPLFIFKFTKKMFKQENNIWHNLGSRAEVFLYILGSFMLLGHKFFLSLIDQIYGT